MKRIQFNGETLQIKGSILGSKGEEPTPNITIVPTTVKYGYLYNYWAITDSKNIANDGWHVPSQTELQTLLTFTGGDPVVSGNALLENSYTYWQYKSSSITNSSKFNLRGSGYRTDAGYYSNIKLETFISTTTESSATKYMVYNTPGDQYMEYASFLSKDKRWGNIVRLVKDSTNLVDGEEGTYIGNDGKEVRTICIGTQEWLADNLSETKYRTGDDIYTTTDSTTWSELSSGGRCVYNNTESNAIF